MRVLAGVIAGALVGTVIVGGGPRAQPAPQDLDRAKDLYAAAQQAMQERRFDDAARDYGAAYEISRDPVLFFKIASANEQAGRCEPALIYYNRYLDEAKPAPEFVKATEERIKACGGTVGDPPAAGSGSAPAPVGSGSAVVEEPPVTGLGSGSGSAVVAPLRAKHQGPWIMIGGSVAMLTIGAVLAYSADASENDIADLYVGLEGTPPVFDARTKQRYDDLVAEGERYEKLSWISFGIAGGLAIGAAVWFYLGRDSKPRDSKSLQLTPTVREDGAGVGATVRW
jgi:hypothetical protein